MNKIPIPVEYQKLSLRTLIKNLSFPGYITKVSSCKTYYHISDKHIMWEDTTHNIPK